MEWQFLLVCVTLCLNNCKGICYPCIDTREPIQYANRNTTYYINVTGAGVVKTVNNTFNIYIRGRNNLKIWLKHHGTIVSLISNRGGNQSHFWNTTLDDLATTPLPANRNACSFFNGTFLPEEKLSKFAEMTINGIWELIFNNWHILYNYGHLRTWTLCITTNDEDSFTISTTHTSTISSTTSQHLHTASPYRKSLITISAEPSISFTSKSSSTTPNSTTMTTTHLQSFSMETSSSKIQSTPSELLTTRTATAAQPESPTSSESLINRTATAAQPESPTAAHSTYTTESGAGKQDQTKSKAGLGPVPIAFIVIGALVAVLLLGAAVYVLVLRGKTAVFWPTVRMSNLRNEK